MIIFTFNLIICDSISHCAHFPFSLEICVLIIANGLKQAKLNIAEIPLNKMLNATLFSCFEFLAHFSLWVCYRLSKICSVIWHLSNPILLHILDTCLRGSWQTTTTQPSPRWSFEVRLDFEDKQCLCPKLGTAFRVYFRLFLSNASHHFEIYGTLRFCRGLRRVSCLYVGYVSVRELSVHTNEIGSRIEHPYFIMKPEPLLLILYENTC